MRVLDLFSGIGGFSLGLERAGHKTVAFCEIDPFCRRILKKHWPDVPCYEDIRELTANRLRADGIAIDAICGGFPCQDISFAGKGAGIEGERSGLWSEYWRLVGELRPRYVIVENVAALLNRGLERVLGDLAAIGYDAEWHCISASAIGAPHRRDRVWIVAYSISNGFKGSIGAGLPSLEKQQHKSVGRSDGETGMVAYANGGPEKRQRQYDREILSEQETVRLSCGCYLSRELERGNLAGQWRTEPNVGRVAHGVPSRVDRLRSLGNAVVPQIPEIIGRSLTSHKCGG